jgi:hypothetical protein
MASGVMPLLGILSLGHSSCARWLAVVPLLLMMLWWSELEVSAGGLLAVPKNKLEVWPPFLEVTGAPLSDFLPGLRGRGGEEVEEELVVLLSQCSSLVLAGGAGGWLDFVCRWRSWWTVVCGGSGQSFPNKLDLSSLAMKGGSCLGCCWVSHRGGGCSAVFLWRSPSLFSGMCVLSSTGLEELRRLLVGDRWAVSSAEERRRSLISGRWAVFFASSSNSLAEGQPFLFLPAKSPDGRQLRLRLVVKVSGLGSVDIPSGWFPGGAGVQARRRRRTRLRSFLSDWGPTCKVKGLLCNFCFSLGPVVICVCMLI